VALLCHSNDEALTGTVESERLTCERSVPPSLKANYVSRRPQHVVRECGSR
jgi:hypothetical protein